MRRKVSFLLMAVVTSVSQGQDWNTLGNLGTNPGTNYLGTQNNQALMLRTDAIQRMRLNATQSYTIGSFTLQPKNGAVGLSSNNTLWANGPGPFSRLHLHDGTTSVLQSPQASAGSLAEDPAPYPMVIVVRCSSITY